MLTNYNRIHFIAVGGSVMHQLAITMKSHGIEVTGSDDHIFEPSLSNLKNSGVRVFDGWDENNVSSELDAVILGMHAKAGNPELQKALDLKIPVLSFPDLIYSLSEDKQRVVVGGSHGKTTITGMIIHVLNYHNRETDYVLGAEVPGINGTIKLTEAPVIIIEGDEYPASTLDSEPKFLKYHHHIGVINGIAWDHINAYPSEDEYLKQFELFADATPKGGSIVFFEEDPLVDVVCEKERVDVNRLSYKIHPYDMIDGKAHLINEGSKIALEIYGKHNIQNLSAAKTLLQRFGITAEEFYDAISSFKGVSNRLETKVLDNGNILIRDFAHSPSKVVGSVGAVKEKFPGKKIIACLELHSYSSLDKEYLPKYRDAMNGLSDAILFYDPQAVKLKGLEEISEKEIKDAFNNQNLKIISDPEELLNQLKISGGEVILLMSSGGFGGLNLENM